MLNAGKGKGGGPSFLLASLRFLCVEKKKQGLGGKKWVCKVLSTIIALLAGWAGLVKWRWGRKEKKERKREGAELMGSAPDGYIALFLYKTLPATIERRRIYVHLLHIHQAMPKKKKKKKKKKKEPPSLGRNPLSLCNAPTYASHVRYRRTPSNDRSLFEFSPN